MAFDHLFLPVSLGGLHLRHRVIMAPLTRCRSLPGTNAPHALNAEYYGQRASEGGLIIAEATQVVPEGLGYPGTPGIHSPEQVAGWKLVTDAVHAKGGKIVLQLWHVGRISHSSMQPGGKLPVAPSAIRAAGQHFTAEWQPAEFETPRALELEEIPGIVAAYAKGAENAKAAGFDGVEVHGANGYLLDQFLQDGTNKRTDDYGGSLENRARLLLEVTDAVAKVWGADRVGVRLSPYGEFNDMHDSDPVALYSYVLQQLSARAIAYAHIIEPRVSNAGGTDDVNHDAPDAAKLFRAAFTGAIIGASGYNAETAEAVITEGKVEAVAFGR
ncbi:MAG: alkene reductase, partial [Chitinophagales bacterium]|nr:alkene reductase [Hyphomicrobiales bacterium]